ncbi:MAG: RNA polymerase sigma factor [Desulfobacteraceae bacterium]
MTQFGTLYKEHRERLFYYLLRLTGDYDLSRDIMQESFARCLGRYGDRIIHIALLYKVARNLVLDHKRKSGRNEPLGQHQPADQTDIEHQVLVQEHYRKVLAALKSLSFQDRELLSLVANESLSYREIALIMGTTENSIKVRVHRARKRLRDAMVK